MNEKKGAEGAEGAEREVWAQSVWNKKNPNAGFPRDTSPKKYQFQNFLLIDLKLAFLSPKNWLERQKERSERKVYFTKSS